MKKVVLIGDSIRMYYQPHVQAALAGEFEVWGPTQNGGTSKNVLDHLDEWAMSSGADIIHMNCGLHDIARKGDEPCQIVLEDYRKNVREILRRLRDETSARVIWALTTPVIGERHHKVKPFDRLDSDVLAYNEAACAIAAELGVEVNDLYTVVDRAGREEYLAIDGAHMTEAGYKLLAEAVCRLCRAG